MSEVTDAGTRPRARLSVRLRSTRQALRDRAEQQLEQAAGEPDHSPAAVTAAVTAGVVPAPFLLVYTGLFLAHGTIVSVDTPDITSSRAGEAVAGVIALVLLLLVVVGIGGLLAGRRRWLFAIGQLVSLGGSCYLLSDRTTGSALLPGLVALTSLSALVLVCLPIVGAYVRRARRLDAE